MKHKQLEELIVQFKVKGTESGLFRRIAEELEKPTRNRRIVNLVKIQKFAKEDELIVVPGKVLATGEITQKMKIAAYSFSNSALEKIKQVKGEAITFDKLVNTKIENQKVRILG